MKTAENVDSSPDTASRMAPKKGKRLSNSEKSNIAQLLSLNFSSNKLKCGLINEIAKDHGVSRMTISKIWKVVLKSIKEGNLPNVERRYKGGKRLGIDLEKVRSIPLNLRTNIRTIASQLGVSTSGVHRLVKKGKLRSHSNALKPFLTASNMIARVNFVLRHIENVTLHTNSTYVEMFNVVHIDEKWFYMTRHAQKYYLLPSEEEPHRTCKSKRFISKVMFMSVIARPRYNEDGVCIFDGKIGIFPITKLEAAKRASKNRAKGVMELKPIDNINKKVIKQCLTEKIIPAIKAKWPMDCSKHIFIQQDNAKPHINDKDMDFTSAAQSDGFHITLTNQPPNRPDLNINDLGFFRVIQILQHEKAPKSVFELVDAVEQAYAQVSPTTLNYVWISLMNCMNEVLRQKGNNNYKLPHMGKQKLERLGLLPSKIFAPLNLVEEAIQLQRSTEESLTGTRNGAT